MNKNQLTCIQNIRFIFNFFEKREWLPGEEPPLNNILYNSKITSQSIRTLSAFLSNRLSRIAMMIEILQAAHEDWRIIGKKDKIIMETENFDFNDALTILANQGFNDDEYVLKIEYERKWGML